jgi:hypothetical protein
MPLFPRVKAMVYFDTPHQQQGRDSRVTATSGGLAAYRSLSSSPIFEVMPSREEVMLGASRPAPVR